MSTQIKRRTMSRLAASRILNCKTSPTGDLCAVVKGIFVNGWTTGKRRRVDRISVCGIAGKTNAVETYKLAKYLAAKTGLITHFHYGMLSKVFNA